MLDLATEIVARKSIAIAIAGAPYNTACSPKSIALAGASARHMAFAGVLSQYPLLILLNFYDGLNADIQGRYTGGTG